MFSKPSLIPPRPANKSINLDDIAKQTNELATKLSTVDLTPGADMQHTINPDVDILHNMKYPIHH